MLSFRTNSENTVSSAAPLLCQTCISGPFSLDHFQEALVTSSDDPGYTYTASWLEIEESAEEAGCNWCSLLTIYRAAATAKVRAETGSAVADNQRIQVRICMEGQRQANRPNELSLFIESTKIGAFKVYANQDDPAANYLGTEDPLSNMTPSIDWTLTSQFIDECSGHEFCQTPTAVLLPTRLIDCSDPDNPRLIITGKSALGRYATLSYVWGGLQPRCLSTLNVDEYRERIPSPLPQTVSDAIFATHQLGVQYLWIDAFCILQDSEPDKLVEISKMHGIYESTYVTLTPEFAYSAREGFLPERRPVMRLPFYTPGPESHLGTMLVRHGLEVSAQWESRLLQLRAQASENSLAFEHIDTRASVHTRAWCFQELTLSPRILLFCHPELYFRCRSATTRVIRGIRHKLRPDLTGMRFLFPKEPRPRMLAPPIPAEIRAGLQSLWHHVVVEYSERRMTLPDDKLVAIAAVAEAFHLAGAGGYVAGLWRATLLEDLMWQVIHARSNVLDVDGSICKSEDQAKVYRAPSWSWASIDDQVHMSSWTDDQSSSITYAADIIEYTITPQSSINPFGAISSAILILQTKIEPVLWNPLRGCLFEFEPELRGEEDETARAAEVREHYFLLILAVGNTDVLGKPWIQGLFMLPTAADGTFRRVGQPYRSSDIPSWYETAPKQIVTLI